MKSKSEAKVEHIVLKHRSGSKAQQEGKFDQAQFSERR